MTGPEHYQAAEQLIKAAGRRAVASEDLLHPPVQRAEFTAQAQVHALLAVAAAYAADATMSFRDRSAWDTVTAPPEVTQ